MATTVKQVALELGLTPVAITKHIKAGRLTSAGRARPGKTAAYLIDDDEARRFIDWYLSTRLVLRNHDEGAFSVH